MTNNKSFTSRMKTRTLVELLKVETLGLVHCGHLYLFSMHRALSRESSDGSPESAAYFFATGQRICKRF